MKSTPFTIVALALGSTLLLEPRPASGVPESCTLACDYTVPCDMPCYDTEWGMTSSCYHFACDPYAGVDTCKDICSNTMACNTSCILNGHTICANTPYSCTEKNTERTYLFSFEVLTYNTWLMPGFGGFGSAPDRNIRAALIGGRLSDSTTQGGYSVTPVYDVILLQEIFDANYLPLYCIAGAGGACDELCNHQYNSYYYGHTWIRTWCNVSGFTEATAYPWSSSGKPAERVGGLPTILHGGLGYLSALPVVYELSAPWPSYSCEQEDCFASKGFQHFRIQHSSMSSPIDLINLHSQASYHDGNDTSDARDEQWRYLEGYLEYFPNSTFILGGDFNTVGPDSLGVAAADEWEYHSLLMPAMNRAFGLSGGPEDSVEDAWTVVHPDNGHGWFYGFTSDECTNTNKSGNCGSTSRRQRIDFLLLNDKNNCYELEVVDATLETFDVSFYGNMSDHFGVAAQIDVYKKEGAGNCRPPDPNFPF